MMKFIFIITMASIIGVQIGLFLLLKQRGLLNSQAFLLSFSMYLIPVLVIMAHRDLYKNRHEYIEKHLEKKEYAEKKKNEIMAILDKKRFLLIVLLAMVKDLLTPKDNLLIIVYIADAYNSTKTMKRRNRIKKRSGSVGIIKKATKVLVGGFVSHASDQLLKSKQQSFS